MYKFNVGYLICVRSISKYDVDHSRVRGEILRHFFLIFLSANYGEVLNLFFYFEYYVQSFLKWAEKASEVKKLPIIVLSELNVIAQ